MSAVSFLRTNICTFMSASWSARRGKTHTLYKYARLRRYPWINRLFQNIPHCGSFWQFVICCICVFVHLYFLFVCLTHGNIIFDILEQSSFQKYTTCWVFLALRHMLYLCICVFVFVYLCMRHLVISVLISLDQVLSENIWFVWSKPSYSGDKWRCHQGGKTQGGTTNQPNNGR